jgi:CDP-diacylglycerol--glycerol-3-phosphate 3-phosphatidyltransferase
MSGDPELPRHKRASLPSPYRQIVVLAIAYGLVWLGGGAILGLGWGWLPAQHWTLVSGLILLYQWVFLWRRAGDIRGPDSTHVRPRIGPGTQLTLLRGFLLAVTGGFLFSPRPPGRLAWIPALSYTLAILADYLDGYLARIYGDVTPLGESLDVEFDALGMLLSTALAIWYGALPMWFLIIGLLRYGFQLGKWILRRMGRGIKGLPASQTRRPIAGMTMGYLSAALWPIFGAPETVVAGAIFGSAMLLSFSRDWLVVSGALDAQSPVYTAARRTVRRVLLGWLPVMIRLLIPVLLIPAVWENVAHYHPLDPGFPAGPSPSELIKLASVGVELLAGGMIVLGVASRTAALLILVPLALAISAQGMRPIDGWRLMAVILVLVLGSGRLSLWQPEERAFSQRAGSPKETAD